MSLIEPPRMMPPIAPIVVDLTERICKMLASHGQGPTCWCGMYPGQQVQWTRCDDCDDGDACGMGYIRPGTTAPYDIFPFAIVDENCVKPLAYELEIGVLRCFQVIQEDGSAPSPNAAAEATLGLLQDQWALYQAIMCSGIKTKAIGTWQPVGPAANCVGGFWPLYVEPNIDP